MKYLIGVGGIALILAIAVLFSSNRRWIRLRVVGAAFALQAGLAILVLYTPWGRAGIESMSRGVSNLLGYAQAGTNFIFGPLAAPEVGGTSFAIAALPVYGGSGVMPGVDLTSNRSVAEAMDEDVSLDAMR